jgi:transcriptional regulator with XRE-family HTH domain
MAEASPGAIIGRNLRTVREAKLFSRADLAERAGVSLAGIDNLERGLSARPRRRTIEKLARALQVDVDTLMEDPAHPLGRAPSALQRSFDNHLAEERRAYGTIRESEHLKGYVRDCLERWRRVARGEDLNLVPDHAYAIETYQHVIALTDWFGQLLRTIKAELPPEAAVAEQREIVALIDDMQEVGAEINAIADAAEGITREAVDEKVQALIDQTVEEYRHKGQRPADELEKRRQRNARDAEREAQQHIAEVKRLAASE